MSGNKKANPVGGQKKGLNQEEYRKKYGVPKEESKNVGAARKGKQTIKVKPVQMPRMEPNLEGKPKPVPMPRMEPNLEGKPKPVPMPVIRGDGATEIELPEGFSKGGGAAVKGTKFKGVF